MHFEYTLSPTEFFEGQKVFCGSLAGKWARFNYKAMVPVGVLLICEGVIAIVWNWDRTLQIILVALGAYYLLRRFVLWPGKMRREYKQYPDRMSRTVEIDENGIVANTSHGRGEMIWARFSNFAETDRVFVILAPPRFIYTLPKRAIPPGAIDELRNLLSRKLGTRQAKSAPVSI